LVWVGDEQEYTVKSGYSVLNMEDEMQTSEAFKLLWGLKISPSVVVCLGGYWWIDYQPDLT